MRPFFCVREGRIRMAEEEEIPETPDKAVRGWIVAIGFTLVLVGGEMMAEKDRSRFYLGVILLCAALPVYLSAAWWSSIKERLSVGQVSSLRLIANDARWWFGLLAIILVWFALSPFVEQQRWPFSKVFHDPPSEEEISKATAPVVATRRVIESLPDNAIAENGRLAQELSNTRRALETQQRSVSQPNEQQTWSMGRVTWWNIHKHYQNQQRKLRS